MDGSSERDAISSAVTIDASTFPRLFWVGMAVLLTAIVFVGFWPTYFGVVVLGQEAVDFGVMEISGVIHLHATVFVGWMALLLTQTGLVAWGRTKTHTTLGQYGAAFGIVVFGVGAFMTVSQWQTAVGKDVLTWAQAPFVAWHSWVGILQFAILLGLGYRFRIRPEAHKCYMVLATAVLVLAATSRMRLLIGPWAMEIMLVVMAGPLFIYDVYAERRIHRATLIGTGILLIFFVLRVLLDW
jgi:hypothetical protein